MTGNPFLNKGPPIPAGHDGRRFNTNAAILEAYLAHVRQVHSSSHYDSSYYNIKKFMEYWGDELLLDLSRRQLLDYAAKAAGVCRWFRRGGVKPRGQPMRPNTCAKKLPLNCSNRCPLYEPAQATTLEQHFSRIAGLFQWLQDEDQIEHNEWEVVQRRWYGQNYRRIKKETSARRYGRRFLKEQEMVRFIENATTWTWKIIGLLGAKYFLRAGEVARLKATRMYLDPDLNWIVVPMAGGNNGKRIIEMQFPIDAETRRYLRVYLRWRDAKLRRCGRDPATYEPLVITKNGVGFKEGKHTGDSLTDGVRRNLKGMGFEAADEIGSHVLRRFASDRAQENGVFGNELKLIRGDYIESDATGNYLDVQRLGAIYAKAMPPLGLCEPPGDFPMEGKSEGFNHQQVGQDEARAAA